MIARILMAVGALALVAAKPAEEAPAAPLLSFVAPPEIASDPANRLTLELSNGGKVVILLRPDAAPAHVERVRTLVGQGFYNGLIFHRVIPGFMAQGGDPKGNGPGRIAASGPEGRVQPRCFGEASGRLGRRRNDLANSQFFIMFGPNVSLDGKYTVFGRVIEGMRVDKIAPGEPPEAPTKPTRIVKATEARRRGRGQGAMRVDLLRFPCDVPSAELIALEAWRRGRVDCGRLRSSQ